MEKERISDPTEAFENAVNEEDQRAVDSDDAQERDYELLGWDVPDDDENHG